MATPHGRIVIGSAEKPDDGVATSLSATCRRGVESVLAWKL